MLKKFDILESQIEDVRSDVETLKEANTRLGGKLLLLEEAISDISALREHTDELSSELKADFERASHCANNGHTTVPSHAHRHPLQLDYFHISDLLTILSGAMHDSWVIPANLYFSRSSCAL